MNRSTRAMISVVALAVVGCSDATNTSGGQGSQLAVWTVDTVPLMRLGAAVDDTTQLFETVIGATRLPDGGVLVADRNDNNLHLYDAGGVHVRGFGRVGTGPGEFEYPARFWRCGDSVLVYDIGGYQTSVFGLDGTFARAFRFGAGTQGAGGQTPYRSACNAAGQFAHYGWDMPRLEPGAPAVFRNKVPFWLSRADSIVTATLDSFPGSERVINYSRQNGLPAGTGPRMFGKQTAIALGRSRLYVGTAERPEVLAIDLGDLSVDTIRIPWTPALLTPEMIAAEKAVRLATSPADRHEGIEHDFETAHFPDTLPPYADVRVDAKDLLWIQGYPVTGAPGVPWTIVSPDFRPMATVALPSHFEVFEIGDDYVLGRYVDPIESIPEVRMYRLRRN